MNSIGRMPRLGFEAKQASNNPEASPGRDWYIHGDVTWPFSQVTVALPGVYYSVWLTRNDYNSADTLQVMFTEEEARALAALLNGLQMGPTVEERKTAEDRLNSQQYEKIEISIPVADKKKRKTK